VPKLKKIILLLFVFLLLASPASAEKIAFRITEDANGQYFISVNGKTPRLCENGACYIDVPGSGTVSGNATRIELTDEDIQKIGQIAAIEINHLNPDGLDYTKLRSIVNDVSEQRQMDDRSWITETWMPKAQEIQNLTVSKVRAEGSLQVLNTQLQNHDKEVDGYKKQISSLEREIQQDEVMIALLLGAIAVLFLSKTDFVRHVREWRSED